MTDQNPPIQFKIVGSETVNFNFVQHPIQEGTDTQYQVSLAFNVEPDPRRISVGVFLSLSLPDEGQELVSMTYVMLFGLERLGDFAHDDGSYMLPYRLMHTVSSIAIGTVRGVLLEKVRGTGLQQFPLPPVDVMDLIGQPREEGIKVIPFSGMTQATTSV